MNINNYVIETINLTKTFGHFTAVEDLNLIVPQNSIFGFLGPNGAGKSTTIKMLLGLMYPTSGKSEIFGFNTKDDSLKIRQRIGYLPQSPTFYKNLTARETLRFVANFYIRNNEVDLERKISNTLKIVGLAKIADRKVGDFSGGERQRLGIAQAQINDPELLILDEPAAALDPQGRYDVLSIMQNLREHTTIFFSTHILDDVQKIADRVAILNKGRLIIQSETKELLESGDSDLFTVSVNADKAESVKLKLADSHWVSSIQSKKMNGIEKLFIHVTDYQIAKKKLLRTILEDKEVIISGFNHGHVELEEVFLELVKDGK